MIRKKIAPDLSRCGNRFSATRESGIEKLLRSAARFGDGGRRRCRLRVKHGEPGRRLEVDFCFAANITSVIK
jgi:hypothetical protein